MTNYLGGVTAWASVPLLGARRVPSHSPCLSLMPWHSRSHDSSTAPSHALALLILSSTCNTLQGDASLEMRTLAYVHHASPVSGAALHVDGDLQLRQRAPLSQGDRVTTWAGAQGSPFAPLLPGVDGTTGLAALQLGGVMNQYLFRNETTVYDYAFPVWHAGSGYASLPCCSFSKCVNGVLTLQERRHQAQSCPKRTRQTRAGCYSAIT